MHNDPLSATLSRTNSDGENTALNSKLLSGYKSRAHVCVGVCVFCVCVCVYCVGVCVYCVCLCVYALGLGVCVLCLCVWYALGLCAMYVPHTHA